MPPTSIASSTSSTFAQGYGSKPEPTPDRGPTSLGELCARLSRASDLGGLVRLTVDGLAELLGFSHSQLFLLDEVGTSLFSIASNGYLYEGVGAEIPIGEGAVGMAAAQCVPVLIGNFGQVTKYAQSVRRSFEDAGEVGPGHEVPLAGLAHPGSQLAIPALALGQLIGVLLVESEEPGRYSSTDSATLTVVASLVASSIESLRREVREGGAVSTDVTMKSPPSNGPVLHLRHFPVDGSTFLNGEYLIKGVAGKLLWSLVRQHEAEGRSEFTNREVRLDPTLELPDYRDNFESRLILLKRRLDEREAAIRIVPTGRGRFRLVVEAVMRLETMGAQGAEA